MRASRAARALAVAVVLPVAGAAAEPPAVPGLVADYLERYFETYPSRATEAGRHDRDHELEDLSPERRAGWLGYNRAAGERLRGALAGPALAPDDRLDAQVLLAQVEREEHALAALKRAERDPLYWTGLLAGAQVFLLVRDDRPLGERLEAALARARLVPRLAEQARQALSAASASALAPEPVAIAARQARATAVFYRDGLAQAAPPEDCPLQEKLNVAGAAAARALDALAGTLDALAPRSSGSPRLGTGYAESFRVGTGVTEPVASLRTRSEAALAAKRAEAAAYGRSVWLDLVPGEIPPADDAALLRRLFTRVADERDRELDAYVAGWRRTVGELESFLREQDVVTLPDPLTLRLEVSPAYFVGQSVGGVYPAGPWAPEAPTLLFLPVPPAGATAEERDAFFRDFNRPFSRMIAPHELLPGHYLQLKWAARQPRRVRALFPDPVYVEGWGTFCERLALELGWGGPLERLAHLKKQLENIARARVDVGVHADGWSRERVLAFVRDEALQDEQFAANMWTRAITSSPQITTYWLGYEEVRSLHDAAQAHAGEAFRLKAFLDGLMQDGPVPLRHYREQLIGSR